MNNTSGIYSLVNKVNGKRYVGQATNIQSRLGQHKSSLKNNNHTNIEMQNDYNLFGSEAFDSPEILEYCTEDKLNQQEIY